jgi:hypothetical protein
MKKSGAIILWVLLCLTVELSHAELIKYTDQNGTLCFADDLGNVPKKYRQNIIRDEEEASVQISDYPDKHRQQGSIRTDTSDRISICYNGFFTALMVETLHTFLTLETIPIRSMMFQKTSMIRSIVLICGAGTRMNNSHNPNMTVA